jgi:hypothetical protein
MVNLFKLIIDRQVERQNKPRLGLLLQTMAVSAPSPQQGTCSHHHWSSETESDIPKCMLYTPFSRREWVLLKRNDQKYLEWQTIWKNFGKEDTKNSSIMQTVEKFLFSGIIGEVQWSNDTLNPIHCEISSLFCRMTTPES